MQLSQFLNLRKNLGVLKIESDIYFNIKIIPRELQKTSSAMRQKGESQNRCYKKIKHGKCLFFRKFGLLCSLVTPVLTFSLLPYYRRNYILLQILFMKAI